MVEPPERPTEDASERESQQFEGEMTSAPPVELHEVGGDPPLSASIGDSDEDDGFDADPGVERADGREPPIPEVADPDELLIQGAEFREDGLVDADPDVATARGVSDAAQGLRPESPLGDAPADALGGFAPDSAIEDRPGESGFGAHDLASNPNYTGPEDLAAMAQPGADPRIADDDSTDTADDDSTDTADHDYTPPRGVAMPPEVKRFAAHLQGGLRQLLGMSDPGEDPDDVSADDGTGIRGMTNPEDSTSAPIGGTPPAPIGRDPHPPLGWQSAAQPPDDDPAGERPPPNLEGALGEGSVDPYAYWTEDHVDMPDVAEPGDRPGEELLDPMPDLDGGSGLLPGGDNPTSGPPIDLASEDPLSDFDDLTT